MVLSVISPYSWPVISQIWLLQLLLDAGFPSPRFFQRIGLLLNCCHGLIFPSGLRVWNIAEMTFDWNACFETFCILPMIKPSQTFTLTVPYWWNDLLNSIQAESLRFPRNSWKHISFILIWPSNSSTLYSNANSNFICFLNKKTWPSNVCTLYSISIRTTCFIYKEKEPSILYYFYLFYIFIL